MLEVEGFKPSEECCALKKAFLHVSSAIYNSLTSQLS
jgi:hypothetical protein